MEMNERGQQLRGVMEECFDVFEKKNEAYGDEFFQENIKDPKMLDLYTNLKRKMQRMKRFSETGTEITIENVKDTLIDLANYAMYGVICIEERKK